MTSLKEAVGNLEFAVDERLFNDSILKYACTVIVDMDTWQILHATPVAESTFGYEMLGALTGKDLQVLVPDKYHDGHRDHNKKFAENPRRIAMGRRILEGKRRDGTIFPVAITIDPVVIGRRRCAVAYIMDMTENGPQST